MAESATQADAIKTALTAALTADTAEQGRQWFEAQLAEDGFMVISAARAAMLLDAERIAAEQGTRLIRANWAFRIMAEFCLSAGGTFNTVVRADIRDWIARGGPANPVPWSASPFFDTWAREQGWVPDDGHVSVTLTGKLIDHG